MRYTRQAAAFAPRPMIGKTTAINTAFIKDPNIKAPKEGGVLIMGLN